MHKRAEHDLFDKDKKTIAFIETIMKWGNDPIREEIIVYPPPPGKDA